MAKIDDMIFNGIKVILSGTPAGIAKQAPSKLKNLIDKVKKDKGKPKGKSPSMVLGSASKAGMQSKQGKRRPPRSGLTPRTGPPSARPKTNGRRGSMVENFRKNRKVGGRGR
jgi:hypothetical protein